VEEFVRRVVYDKFFREIDFLDQGERVGEVSDMGAAVAVAGKEYRVMVFPTKFQYGAVVFFCLAGIPAITVRSQGAVVDFQKNAAVHGGFHKAVVIDRIFGVVGVGDNADVWIFYGMDIGFCIFLHGAWGKAGEVHAGHAVV